MIKRVLFALIVLTSSFALGQNSFLSYSNTTTGSSAVIKQIGTGVSFHKVTFTDTGTITTCTVKIEQSADGVTSWTDLIAATTCTSNGASAVTAGTANYVRITFATKSGSGTTTAVYTGYINDPTGGGGGSGTVTHTVGALTSSSVVIGNGSADVKVSGVVTTDESNSRLCVNTSTCDTGVKYGSSALQYLGAFGNGKTTSDGNNHRFFTDEGTWTPTVTGKGAASFAAALTITGALGVDHHAGFESVQNVAVTVLPLALLYGFYDAPTVAAGATVSVRRGLHIGAVNNSGTVTTNEAIYIAPDTTGGGNNYTIFSDKVAPSVFAGQAAFGGIALPTEDVYAVNGITGAYYKTNTNCSSIASPAVCASASAGSVNIVAATGSIVVNTTRVTANSQIIIHEDSSLGTKLGVTCNTTTGRIYTITARTAGTSFTIGTSANPVTNPACLSYWILN